MPPELAYVALAERFGCSPLDVLAWPEEVVEDVALYVRTTNADARVNRAMRGLA